MTKQTFEKPIGFYLVKVMGAVKTGADVYRAVLAHNGLGARASQYGLGSAAGEEHRRYVLTARTASGLRLSRFARLFLGRGVVKAKYVPPVLPTGGRGNSRKRFDATSEASKEDSRKTRRGEWRSEWVNLFDLPRALLSAPEDRSSTVLLGSAATESSGGTYWLRYPPTEGRFAKRSR